MLPEVNCIQISCCKVIFLQSDILTMTVAKLDCFTSYHIASFIETVCVSMVNNYIYHRKNDDDKTQSRTDIPINTRLPD